MASKVIYERFLWFYSQVKKGMYPNATTMAEHFEISPKTAQRDIEFMQSRLFAPLVYVHAKRGYAFEDDTYELPASWLNAEELTSLLVSFRLASTVPDSGMKTRLKSFLDQVLSLYTHEIPISLEELGEKVSVKNIEYSRTNGKTFQQMFDALLHKKPLAIEYYSPHNDESTVRDILPLHLLSYMGTWHIIAFCTLRGELRDFALSRIRKMEPSPSNIAMPKGTASLKDYIRRNFGILNSTETHEVCIRFSAGAAPWIAEQVWHPDQKVKKDPDGSLCLSFPVADFREVKREIMRYGAQVEVLSPERLRQEVREEIERMSFLYS
jgi:predicted DNA-binding transcriptional regulator YafY